MATTDFSPPAQIDTATVSLRRWTESDADGLRRVVTESFDHLIRSRRRRTPDAL
jgi:hypothetical protein